MQQLVTEFTHTEGRGTVRVNENEGKMTEGREERKEEIRPQNSRIPRIEFIVEESWVDFGL